MTKIFRALLALGFVAVAALPARADFITDSVSGPLDFTVFAAEAVGPDALSSSIWQDHLPGLSPDGIIAAVPLATFTDAPTAEPSPLSSIPEPATLLLFGSGLASLLIRRRRRA